MHEQSRPADGGELPGGSVAANAIQQEPLAIAIQQEPLATVPLNSNHRTAGFVCGKSGRVGGFFAQECRQLIEKNYCRVFVLPSPDDATEIWGFYSLSPSLLFRGAATG